MEKLEVGRCLPGNTAECYDGPPETKGIGICKAGTKTCQPDGTLGLCAGQVLPAAEIPGNNIDEDCDGHDEPVGGCTPGQTQACYSGPAGTEGVGICRAGTQTCLANRTFGPCTGEVLPQTEILDNGSDEDCSGSDAHAVFTLTAAPSTAKVIRGQPVSYTIEIDGTGFTQLVDLTLSGLPAEVTGSFVPQHVAVGQTSLLTIIVPETQALQTLPFTISASVNITGTPETQTVPLSLTILPIATSFVGRTVVADDLQTPLASVSVSLLGRDGSGNATGCTGETVSDAAGNFMFTNLPHECTSGQLIRYDGTTSTTPPGKYAGVDLFYDIIENQVNTSPVLIHLPRIDDKEFVCVQQNAPQDQTFTFQTIPNMSVTVYAGTTFTPHPQYPPPAGKCAPGFFGLIAIDVPVDRLPDAMPPGMPEVMPFIVAFQPPNAVASQPVAVSFPNLLNTPPSTNMALMTLDPTKGVMVNYGTGTVSPDGTHIIPDLNPAAPSKRYGLVHFDWHGPAPTPPPQTNPSPEPNSPKTCEPLDLSSGLKVIRETDIALNGLRGSIFLQRVYRTLSNAAGPFGIETSHNYGYRLNTNNPQGAAVNNNSQRTNDHILLRLREKPAHQRNHRPGRQ